MVNSVETYILTAGADTVSGTASDTLIETNPADLNAADELIGGDGLDTISLLADGVVDFTAASILEGFENVSGSVGNDTFVFSSARLTGFSTINGGVGLDVLQLTGGGAIDLVGVNLASIEKIMLTDVAGTQLSGVTFDDNVELDAYAGSNDSITLSGDTEVYQAFWASYYGFETVHSQRLGATATTTSDGVTATQVTTDISDSFDWQVETRVLTLDTWLTVSVENLLDTGDTFRADFRADGTKSTTSLFDTDDNASWSSITTALASDGITRELKTTTYDGGNMLLQGTAADETLFGGGGRDVLRGGDGADTLMGGAGADRLEGGIGADVFVYGNVSDSNSVSGRDKIVDFELGVDKVDLSAISPNTLTFRGTLAINGDDQVRIVEQNGNSIVRVVDDAGDAMMFTIQGVIGLQVSDFIL